MAGEPQQSQQFQSSNRAVPFNELELYMQLADGAWGTSDLPDELRQKLQRVVVYKDSDGKVMGRESEDLWSILAFYRRDMRLANLDDREMYYCQYHLDLANDLLQENYIKAFLIALARAATILELSQSKRGFFRKQLHTLTTEHVQKDIEAPKKTLFGFGQSKNQG